MEQCVCVTAHEIQSPESMCLTLPATMTRSHIIHSRMAQ